MPRLRLVVLISGRGSNLEALLNACRDGRCDADIVRVVANRADASGLALAKAAAVDAVVVPSSGLARDAHEAALARAIDEARPDLVALAGYMRILGPDFVRRYQGRLINIHPSLLPAFPGLDAPGQAARAGVRVAGCTTHFVTEATDAGPILMQGVVALSPGVSPEELATRILRVEHRVYPATVQLLASGRARWHQDSVAFAPDVRADELVIMEMDS